MAKNTIKICRYQHCKHETKEIDISTDEYVVKNRMYFHKDCYQAKVNGEWKDEHTKANLQLIKNLWVENISDTVVFSQLFHILNDLIDKNIGSDYLVFVMQYVIKHKLNLNYPAGFRYFVDKKEIKESYAKHCAKAIRHKNGEFVIVEKEDAAPKFSIKRKTSGFQSILKK